MALKLGHFSKQIRNTWKVLKCGAGEGWKKSVGLKISEMSQGGEEYPIYNKKKEG
jgi:hypothetical protein